MSFCTFFLEDKQYAGIQLQRKSSLDVQLAQNNAFQGMRLLYIWLYYWPSERSRWLDIGHVLFCILYGPRWSQGHKHAKRERGQYPAILTELAWSIKHLLYGIHSFILLYHRQFQAGSITPSIHLDSQSQHRIWFILPTHRANRIMK